MVDLHTILADHRLKRRKLGQQPRTGESEKGLVATASEIPDLFFDQVLLEYKLTRVEIVVLMYIYRHVWCRPNLYKKYGISQLLSHTEMANSLNIELDNIYHALRKLEEYGFLSTIRSGQYFVRKYFTKDNDEIFVQTYDDFDV